MPGGGPGVAFLPFRVSLRLGVDTLCELLVMRSEDLRFNLSLLRTLSRCGSVAMLFVVTMVTLFVVTMVTLLLLVVAKATLLLSTMVSLNSDRPSI